MRRVPRRYHRELEAAGRLADLEMIRAMARTRTVTLVFAAKDAEHCNAAALKEFIEHP